ncbi:lysosomal thioesterase PPT2-like isoform X2 [Nerophis ophidion]|uniref:lysosomal thioesterase PPT2-like isoform X2 n=1 Tax=Nerophis ophidion TaxID=159077 RepID=UPI002ADF7F4D|nr:lysosomal thioesterase PPT2-like isoform X2 [Nerophis ophidion]
MKLFSVLLQRQKVLHFPSVQMVLKDNASASEAFDKVAKKYSQVINRVGQEFENRFCDLDQLEPCVSFISNPFMNVDISCIAEQLSATLSLDAEQTHPGTEVTVVDVYDHMASLQPLWKQVEGFRKAVEPIMRKAPHGVHLLCFSQDTEYLRNLFPDSVKKTLFLVCYNGVGQKVSVCGYWNDPHHRSRYLKSNNFLPLLNGDTPHKEMEAWKDNFLRIKKLVLIGGPDDGVITPWQSSHFGFYDNKERIVEMRNQKFYRNDTFGLKTLSARGDVSLCLQSGVQHIRWHSNYTVFSSCMEEWLT